MRRSHGYLRGARGLGLAALPVVCSFHLLGIQFPWVVVHRSLHFGFNVCPADVGAISHVWLASSTGAGSCRGYLGSRCLGSTPPHGRRLLALLPHRVPL